MKRIVFSSLLVLSIAGSAHAEYLGNLSANQYDSNSTSNPYGKYGSPYSSESINNPYGQYGSPYSDKSATNPYATHAPKLYNNGGGGVGIYGE